jgi:uncharacterized protein YydD (DUF2326 family)
VKFYYFRDLKFAVRNKVYMKDVSFIMSLNTVALSHRKPSSSSISHNSCHVQGEDKRDNIVLRRVQHYKLRNTSVHSVVTVDEVRVSEDDFECLDGDASLFTGTVVVERNSSCGWESTWITYQTDVVSVESFVAQAQDFHYV